MKPQNGTNKDVTNGGAVLLRGQVVAKNPRKSMEGWVFMTSMQVREFLGISLLLAMPRDWLKDP